MTSNVSNYVSHAHASTYKPPQMDDPKVTKTAKDFEAMTLSQMLTPMMETNDDDEEDMMGHGSSAEKQFRSLEIQELGKEMSKAGGVGIAQQVYSKMKEMQDANKMPHHVNKKN